MSNINFNSTIYIILQYVEVNFLMLFLGIRRKRLKGDTWAYKKMCEDVLKEAQIQEFTSYLFVKIRTNAQSKLHG